MDNSKYKMILSRIRFIVGVVFWIVPLHLLAPRLPIDVEHSLAIVQIILGVVLCAISLFVRAIDGRYGKKSILVYVFLVLPTFVCLYFSWILFLVYISVEIHGMPSDVLQ